MIAKSMINIKVIIAIAVAAALAFGMMAPALAKQPDRAVRGNSLSSVAVPVVINAGDIGSVTCANGNTYYTVQHNLGANHGSADDILWREPNRLGGQNVSFGGGIWNTLYLGIANAQCAAIRHKGQVTVYYVYGNDVYSITAEFNGKGELLSVNGVAFE